MVGNIIRDSGKETIIYNFGYTNFTNLDASTKRYEVSVGTSALEKMRNAKFIVVTLSGLGVYFATTDFSTAIYVNSDNLSYTNFIFSSYGFSNEGYKTFCLVRNPGEPANDAKLRFDMTKDRYDTLISAYPSASFNFKVDIYY